MNTAIVKANPVLITLIFGILSFTGIFSAEAEDPLSYRIFAVVIASMALTVMLIWLNAIADVASRSGVPEARAEDLYLSPSDFEFRGQRILPEEQRRSQRSPGDRKNMRFSVFRTFSILYLARCEEH